MPTAFVHSVSLVGRPPAPPSTSHLPPLGRPSFAHQASHRPVVSRIASSTPRNMTSADVRRGRRGSSGGGSDDGTAGTDELEEHEEDRHETAMRTSFERSQSASYAQVPFAWRGVEALSS